MRKLNLHIILLLFVVVNCCAQESKLKIYHFDRMESFTSLEYPDSTKTDFIILKNSKDSLYTFTINNRLKIGILDDIFNKIKIKTKFRNPIISSNQLYQIDTANLYKTVYNKNILSEKLRKKIVDEMEFERDSITEKSILHLTYYKNSKKRNILNEHYYIFGINAEYNCDYKKNIKSYIKTKYNISLPENVNLVKSICILNGKKNSETTFHYYKIINLNTTIQITNEFADINSFN